jgi:hypothetical protein
MLLNRVLLSIMEWQFHFPFFFSLGLAQIHASYNGTEARTEGQNIL